MKPKVFVENGRLPVFFLCAAFALMAASSLALAGCQSLRAAFQEPVISINSVEIVKINFTGVELLCKVNVENPNSFSIPFPELDWDLFINSGHFVRGTVKNDNPLRSRQKTVVDVPVSLNYTEIYNTFNSIRGASQADYRIALDVKFNLPVLGGKVWHLEHEGIFPLLQMPTLSFGGIAVRNVSLTRLDVEVSWEVENNNNFAMTLNDLFCSLAVNNSQWMSTSAPKALQIGPKRKTQIPLSVSISSLNMVRDISGILLTGTDVAYQCEGSLNIGADFPGLDNFALPFNFSGRTRLLR